MIFGLNRTTDEKSLLELLEQFSRKQLTQVLIPRMKDEEINQLADLLMNVLRSNLSHQEYHRLVLEDSDHNE